MCLCTFKSLHVYVLFVNSCHFHKCCFIFYIFLKEYLYIFRSFAVSLERLILTKYVQKPDIKCLKYHLDIFRA